MPRSAQAQTYPSKAVRLVVPFAAGGSTDIIARTLAQKLNEMWGQPVIVDNRAGGSTVIGTDVVAKAPPDGHTLLVTPAPFTIVPSLAPKLPYDPHKDFEPITLINTTPLVVVVHPGVPAKSIKELIALAKAKPGALNFGSSGSGGSNHLAGELFNAMAGVKMVHVPYKGNAPALTDLVGGHVDLRLQRAHFRAAAHQVREAARARHDEPQARRRAARGADASTSRASRASRRSHGTASPRPRARRRTSSRSSTPTCSR